MKNIVEEIVGKIWETGELYDELYNIIEGIEIESLKPDNNLFYDIYFDPNNDSFDVYEFSDDGSLPSSERLIHIISIENVYNDAFWAEIEINKDWTIEDAIGEIISEVVDFDMEKAKKNLNDRLADY